MNIQNAPNPQFCIFFFAFGFFQFHAYYNNLLGYVFNEQIEEIYPPSFSRKAFYILGFELPTTCRMIFPYIEAFPNKFDLSAIRVSMFLTFHYVNPLFSDFDVFSRESRRSFRRGENIIFGRLGGACGV